MYHAIAVDTLMRQSKTNVTSSVVCYENYRKSLLMLIHLVFCYTV